MASYDSHLAPDSLLPLLERVNRRLEQEGRRGVVQIVGGSAMMLAGIGDRVFTADIDARLGLEIGATVSFDTRELVERLAAEIREEAPPGRALAPDWLNSKAQHAIPSYSEPLWITHTTMSVLTVQYAAPEMLLAMKLRASRNNGRDGRDIRALMDHLGLSRTSQAVEVLERFFPDYLPEPNCVLLMHRIGVEDDLGLGAERLSGSAFWPAELRRRGVAPPAETGGSELSNSTCGRRLPRADRRCALPAGHRGQHR